MTAPHGLHGSAGLSATIRSARRGYDKDQTSHRPPIGSTHPRWDSGGVWYDVKVSVLTSPSNNITLPPNPRLACSSHPQSSPTSILPSS